MKPLDIRDISIIDAFPVYNRKNIILNVGCGEGRIDKHLGFIGYRVYAVDIKQGEEWDSHPNLTFHKANIFDLKSFPISSSPVVICSEVLEHLKDYKIALANLLKLAEIRLIITVPFKKSFGGESAGHCNFWDDSNVGEFKRLCNPYSTSISKIRTKGKDVQMKQFCYLIIVDKRQDKIREK